MRCQVLCVSGTLFLLFTFGFTSLVFATERFETAAASAESSSTTTQTDELPPPPIDSTSSGDPVDGSLPSQSPKPPPSEGVLLYNRAQRLLNHVQAHSTPVPPRTSLQPSASFLSPSSYAPLLDRASWLNRGIFSYLIKLVRQTVPSTSSDDANDSRSSERKRNGLINFLLLPRRIFDKFGRTSERITKGGRKNGSAKILGQRDAEEATYRAAELLERATYEHGNPDAGLALGNLWLWGGTPPGLIKRNATKAMQAYKWVADLTGNATAQANLAFLYATGYGGVLGNELVNTGDQSTALLYYTFAALGGDYAAEMSLGYRHWTGIGTKQSCSDALPFYKSAATKAMKTFNSGPPGGHHMPPLKVRLSDRDGGVYGPGASVASTGTNRHQHSPQHPATVQEWNDVLEFYQFHAERGDATFMFRLGRIYYYGFGTAGDDIKDFAVTNGRNFRKALMWFNRIARTVWPRDPEAATSPTGQSFQNSQGHWQTPVIGAYDASKDVKLKVDEHQAMAAGLAAGFLGRLYLRGEGVPRNNAKAFLWFSRGEAQGDRESHNGLGIMYRDGLGVQEDIDKAVDYFQTAANAELADAHVNLAKYYMGVDDYVSAVSFFDSAIKHGDSFQSYFYLAEINSEQIGRVDLCPIAVAFYKRVAERGDWFQEVYWKAEKAWADGDEATALLGYWMTAERGYEVAQNNMAYILDRHKRRIQLPIEQYSSNSTDRLALTYWTRSAAQDNIDALVKMGDYYLSGYGSLSGLPQPEKAAACYQTATNTHLSAMSMWNLGWMHENGIGVSQDYHLAKRFYDLALETNTEASLPVTLSLIKLYARSLWGYVVHGNAKHLSLFTYSNEDAAKSGWWSLRKVRDEITSRWFGIAPPAGANQDGGPPRTPNGDMPMSDAEAAAFDVTAAQRALQQDDDPVEWARNARDRERLQTEEGDDDDLFLAGEAGDDFIETIGILFLCLGLGAFIFLRQQREQANARAETERQATEVPETAVNAAPTPTTTIADNTNTSTSFTSSTNLEASTTLNSSSLSPNDTSNLINRRRTNEITNEIGSTSNNDDGETNTPAE